MFRDPPHSTAAAILRDGLAWIPSQTVATVVLLKHEPSAATVAAAGPVPDPSSNRSRSPGWHVTLNYSALVLFNVECDCLILEHAIPLDTCHQRSNIS